MAKDTRQAAAERWFFLGAFLAGGASLYALRFGLEIEHSAITAAFALCGLILLYAWIMHSRGSFRLLRNEQSADNLYYLGFIFTVCALGVSLLRFATVSGVTTLHIVGDLGVGLSTTVVGLVLRVLALHREDPAEIEDRVRSELIDVAESTTAVLRKTAGVVEQGQIITRQTIDELNRTLRQTADEIGAGVRAIEESLDAIRIPPDLIVSRLTPVVTQLSDSASAFVEKVNAIDIPADLVATRFDRAAAEVTIALTDAVNRSGEEVGRRVSVFGDRVVAQAQDTLQRVDTLVSTRVDEIEIPTDLVTRRVAPLISGLDDCTTRLISSFEAMVSTVANIERTLGGLFPGFGDRLGPAFEDMHRRLTELGSALAALETDGIRSLGVQMKEARATALDDLRQTKELVESQHDSTAQLNLRIDSLSEHLLTTNRMISDGLAKLEELGRLFTTIADRIETAAAKEKVSPSRRWPFGR